MHPERRERINEIRKEHLSREHEPSDEEVRKKTDTGKLAFYNGSDTASGMQERRNYMKKHPEDFK